MVEDSVSVYWLIDQLCHLLYGFHCGLKESQTLWTGCKRPMASQEGHGLIVTWSVESRQRTKLVKMNKKTKRFLKTTTIKVKWHTVFAQPSFSRCLYAHPASMWKTPQKFPGGSVSSPSFPASLMLLCREYSHGAAPMLFVLLCMDTVTSCVLLYPRAFSWLIRGDSLPVHTPLYIQRTDTAEVEQCKAFYLMHCMCYD